MAATKIRRDAHGPYVVTNGSYYRPILANGHNHVPGARKGDTAFRDGAVVKASAVAGSQLCRVRSEGILETWFAHGANGAWIDGKRKPIPSTDAYMPASNDWTGALTGSPPPVNAKSREDLLAAIGIRETPVAKALPSGS